MCARPLFAVTARACARTTSSCSANNLIDAPSIQRTKAAPAALSPKMPRAENRLPMPTIPNTIATNNPTPTANTWSDPRHGLAADLHQSDHRHQRAGKPQPPHQNTRAVFFRQRHASAEIDSSSATAPKNHLPQQYLVRQRIKHREMRRTKCLPYIIRVRNQCVLKSQSNRILFQSEVTASRRCATNVMMHEGWR